MKKRPLWLVLSLVLLTLVTACQNPIAAGGTEGSLTLSITDNVSRTLLPTLSMTPALYTVAGTGPGGATFSLDSTGTLTVNKLAFGSWSVTVTAKNAAGTSIGSGAGTVVVHSNQSSTLAIIVSPFVGNGTLTLGLNWTAADVETAQVESSLLPSSGNARALNFTVDGTTGTASFAVNDVAAGYHTLAMKLKDNGALVMGAVEVVRIVKDRTTTGNYTFAKINKPGGTLVVNIEAAMGDPLTVTIAGASVTKPEDQTRNLTASVAEAGVNATYVWYVNGEQKNSGAVYTFDGSWAQGSYRIDVTAYSADGTRAGSQTAGTIEVVAPVGPPEVPLVPSWTKYTTANGLAADGLTSVAVSGNTLYVGTYGSGLSVSSNGGSTWTTYTTVNGLASNNVYGLAVVGSTLYAATYGGGLSVSTDAGNSWTTFSTSNGLASNNLQCVAVSGSTICVGSYGGGLSVSTNNGVSWSNYTQANGLAQNQVFGVYVTGSAIYAATLLGLSVSTNNGSTWTTFNQASGLGDNWVMGVTVANSTIYASTGNGGLSMSGNNGANWTTASTTTGLAGNTVKTVVVSGSSIYAPTWGGGLGISNDGGVTWTKHLQGGTTDALSAVAVAGGKIYATTSQGLMIGQ